MAKQKKINVRLRIPYQGKKGVTPAMEACAFFKSAPDVMTVKEAAKQLRCSKNTLYAIIKEGRLAVVRIGRCIRVPKTALTDFMMNEGNYCFVSDNSSDNVWTLDKRRFIVRIENNASS